MTTQHLRAAAVEISLFERLHQDMSLYRCTIAHDGANRQIVVHWDDNDPNRHIVAPTTIPASETSEDRLAHELGRMGFRVVSTDSDNIGRGWAVVAHTRADWPFYNPLTQGWCAYLDDTAKQGIRARWPEADVPGVR